MQDRLEAMMKAAAKAGIVVPAFNVPYLPMVEAISNGVTPTGAFALIEVSRIEFEKFEAGSPAAVAEEYRRTADRETTRLHLDHVPAIDEDGLEVDWEALIRAGLDCGYDSVMLDGSRLDFEANVRTVSRVVELAHAKGAMVEAELGAVLGHEAGPLPPYEELFRNKTGFTDPEQAREFVERTGVDWLSVSVGSVHGAITAAARTQKKVAARIDIEHLKKLREATGLPLVLHGGSGVQRSYVLEAVRNGIAKINIGTEIRQVYERVVDAGGSIPEAQAAVSESVSAIIRDGFGVEGSLARLRQLAEG